MASHSKLPGQVLDATWELQSDFLDSLSALLANDRQLARLAARTRDRRITLVSYELVLRRELLQLSLWSSQRLFLAAKQARSRTVLARPDSVLGLLPTAAPAVHLLRRVIPFAAHGLPTFVSFPVLGQPEGQVAVGELARALRLDNWMQLSEVPPQAALSHHRNAFVVATGRRSTLQRLAASESLPRLLGAAGRCAVILGADIGMVRRAYHFAAKHRVLHSCTNVRIALCVTRRAGRQVVVNPWSGSDLRMGLVQILRRLHPSVVYWAGKEEEPRQLATSGYAVFRTSSSLAVSNLAGFGRDPLFHWPGDYCV